MDKNIIKEKQIKEEIIEILLENYFDEIPDQLINLINKYYCLKDEI
jgi:hypothetical protein